MAEDRNAKFGTKRSGYVPGDFGPFNCEHCTEHYAAPHYCDHPDVIADAKAGEPWVKLGKRGKQEAAIIDSAGCCEYQRKANARMPKTTGGNHVE